MRGNLHFIPHCNITRLSQNPVVFTLSASTIWTSKAALIDLLLVAQRSFRFHFLSPSCLIQHGPMRLHRGSRREAPRSSRHRTGSHKQPCPQLRQWVCRRSSTHNAPTCRQLGAPVSSLSDFRLFETLQTQLSYPGEGTSVFPNPVHSMMLHRFMKRLQQRHHPNHLLCQNMGHIWYPSSSPY